MEPNPVQEMGTSTAITINANCPILTNYTYLAYRLKLKAKIWLLKGSMHDRK